VRLARARSTGTSAIAAAGGSPGRSHAGVLLRSGVVDEDDRGSGELHPPGARVETCAENHHLWVRGVADDLVDRLGARDDDLGASVESLYGKAPSPAGGSDARAGELDVDELVRAKQPARDRVGEPTDGEAPVRDRSALAHEDRRPARASRSVGRRVIRHRVSVAPAHGVRQTRERDTQALPASLERPGEVSEWPKERDWKSRTW
jgi:hypothetical protein